MGSRLRMFREQQYLSAEFIHRATGISVDLYRHVEESGDLGLLTSNQQIVLLTLLGIEKQDLLSAESLISDEVKGIARTYKQLSSRDKLELNKLLNFRDMLESAIR